jgi:hypothetical protein
MDRGKINADLETVLKYSRQWDQVILSLITGVEKELCASAPQKARWALAAMRARAATAKSSRSRKKVEADLDALVEVVPCIRAAATRYVDAELKWVLARTTKVVRELGQQVRSFPVKPKM